MKKFVLIVFIVILIFVGFFFLRRTHKKDSFDECVQKLMDETYGEQYASNVVLVKFQNEQIIEKIESLLPKSYNISFTKDNKAFYINIPSENPIKSVCELKELEVFENVDVVFIDFGV